MVICLLLIVIILQMGSMSIMQLEDVTIILQYALIPWALAFAYGLVKGLTTQTRR